MKNIKKFLAILIAMSISCAFLTSCGSSGLETEGLTTEDSVESTVENNKTDKYAKKEADSDKADNSDAKTDKSKSKTNKKTNSNTNKYNKDYINITGKTVGELAKEQGIDFDEYLAQNGYPEDMPEDTYEAAAYYSRTVEQVAEDNGITVEEFKMIFGLGDEVTGETTWGDAYDLIPLRNLVGESGLDAFKQEFGLGDDVTLDTKWGEIRNIVDEHERKERMQNGMAQ